MSGFRICLATISQTKKRYAIVGTGARSYMYAEALADTFAVDTLIVTSIDRTHHEYITRAMSTPCGNGS